MRKYKYELVHEREFTKYVEYIVWDLRLWKKISECILLLHEYYFTRYDKFISLLPLINDYRSKRSLI